MKPPVAIQAELKASLTKPGLKASLMRAGASFSKKMPITAKLNPLHLENIGFLLTGAALVRIGVGVLRCMIDWTNPDRKKSLWDKRSESWERILGGEITGTGLFLFMLNAGQDWMANRLQAIDKYSPKYFVGNLKTLSDTEKSILSDAMEKGLGSLSRDGLYSRLLYENFGFAQIEHALKATPQGSEILKKVAQPLSEYAGRLKMGGYKVFAAGAFAAALFGGFISQVLNDWVFARLVIPNINRAMGVKDPAVQEKKVEDLREKTLEAVTSQISQQFRFPSPPALQRGDSNLPQNGIFTPPVSPFVPSVTAQGGYRWA